MMEKLKARIRANIAKKRQERFDNSMLEIQEFAHKHSNLLLIVCNPKDDMMFASYRKKQICAKIKSEDGVERKIVKDMLRHSTFEHEIDRFIGAIIFGLKISLEKGSSFFHFIDGALHNITKSISLSKKK